MLAYQKLVMRKKRAAKMGFKIKILIQLSDNNRRNQMIYLDYNATTPIDPEVYHAMKTYFENQFGNPSNTYDLGKSAKAAVERAREQVANFIGAKPHEITFTSCGSESNNTVIKGVAYKNAFKGKHIITSVIEHPAIMEPLKFLEKNGFDVSYVPVDQYGAVHVEDVKNAMREDTILVSIMHSNNEVGTLQPIQEIGRCCKERGILFHTDASQSMGKVPIDVNQLHVDFLTIAGHKLYAPKGIGALYIREGAQLEQLLHGARQEKGLRAGTENVPYDVALGTAAEIASRHLQDNTLFQLKEYFYHQLENAFGDKIHLNGDFINSLPNTLNISFIGESGSDILNSIPEINASTGSACHSGEKTISPVLAAMGVDPEIAYGAIRFSVGRFTTKDEIDQTVEELKKLLFK